MGSLAGSVWLNVLRAAQRVTSVPSRTRLLLETSGVLEICGMTLSAVLVRTGGAGGAAVAGRPAAAAASLLGRISASALTSQQQRRRQQYEQRWCQGCQQQWQQRRRCHIETKRGRRMCASCANERFHQQPSDGGQQAGEPAAAARSATTALTAVWLCWSLSRLSYVRTILPERQNIFMQVC